MLVLEVVVVAVSFAGAGFEVGKGWEWVVF